MPDETLLLIVYGAGALLLMALAVPMIRGKVPPNGLYGFRVPKTMNNPDIWYPANAYAGRQLLWAGLAILLGVVVLYFILGNSLDAYALASLGLVLIALGIAVWRSVRYLKDL